MPKFASLQLFKSHPVVARLLAARALMPQQPGQCYFDHGRLVLVAAGIPDGRCAPLRRGSCRLGAEELRAALQEGPLLLSGRNVALPGSNYVGMHTIALLGVVTFGDRERVLGIDLDDTVRRPPFSGHGPGGNFGGVLYDFSEICDRMLPFMDETSGLGIDMYQRPQARGTCTIL